MKNRGHEFEREQEGLYGKVQREIKDKLSNNNYNVKK